MFRSHHHSLLAKAISDSMQLRELVNKSSAILHHRAQQELDEIHAAVFNFQQHVKPGTQNDNANNNHDGSDYLSASLRLRGDCFLTTQHSFVDYNEMDKNNKEIIAGTTTITNTIFTPPTHYSDLNTGLIGTPSAHHVMNSVALYYATGKHLASRSEDNTVQDFEFACNRSENFVIRGTKSSLPCEGATKTLNYTIFINDVESVTLEPNFVAAIKDAVEFASGYIMNTKDAKNKIRLNVTVIALAPREILIDLAQSKELEDCESRWNFSEHVTLVLVPTYSYYSLAYMRNALTCDDSCDYSLVIQHSEKLLSRNGLKLAFNYTKNNKTTFFMHPWLKQPLMLLREIAQAQNENQYADGGETATTMPNPEDKNAANPGTAVPSPADQRKYAAKSLSNRLREEEFQRMQRKIAATSRRSLIVKIRQDLNKSVKEFLMRSE